MHITAYCPTCRSRYQLDPALRGQRMRCPNPVCREVFEVQDAEPEEAKSTEIPTEPVATLPETLGDQAGEPPARAESPPTSVPTTGSVGDMVPILDAEVVHEVPPPVVTAESLQTGAPVHEAVPADQDEDAKPIPVDGSLVPPPIEVENLVPLDPEEEARARPVQEVPSWHVPPPVRNPQASTAESRPSEGAAAHPSGAADVPSPALPARKSKSRPKKLPSVPAKLSDQAQPSWYRAPPIRRRPNQLFSQSEPSGPAPSREGLDSQGLAAGPIEDMAMVPAGTSRRTLWVIGAMVVVAGFIIATITIVTLNAYVQTEDKRYAHAKGDYEQRKYASAANTSRNLLKDFPNSENRPFYQLLAELSEVRDQVYAAQARPDEALTTVQQFLGANHSNPLLKAYRTDIGQTLDELAKQFTALAMEEHDPALLAQAKEVLDQSKRYKPAGSIDNSALQEKVAEAATTIDRWQRKQRLLQRLKQWLDEPSVESVQEARRLARRESLEQDPEVRAGIVRLETASRGRVRYVANGSTTPEPVFEAVEPSLLVVPAVLSAAKPTIEGKRAVLALARGVLYALDQGTGQELWATRVGIDTATLPVRLGATPTSPELFLVLSADRNTMMALEALTGRVFWQHRLSAPCLGRPVVVRGKAFVPTYDGRVHEIEIFQGKALGHFELGQPLTVGGAWQEGTDLLYFPGDSDYLYVLDVPPTDRPNQPPRTKQCVAILYTGHPSGSLRTEPMLVNRMDPVAKRGGGAGAIPGYLILTQTDGLDHMKLRVFRLPIDNPEAPPLLQQEPRVRGWSWLPPYHDGERLALVTDVGAFELFGINQVRNDDKALFRQLSDERDERKSAGAGVGLGRAQVVHVAENDFWVLAQGMLKRLHFDLFGQQMVPVWNQPLPLGSPVHAAQIDETEKVIFVVTQDLTSQNYLATAVAAEDGRIKWQRQLGLECQSDPLVLGREVVTVDRGGGLCVFDGSKYRHQEQREWRRANPFYAAPVPGGAVSAYLLPGSDGVSVYEIACPVSGGSLTVRRYQNGRVGDKPVLLETATTDKGPALAGTPAIVGQSLLLPMADGTIRRFPLALTEGLGEGGPDWRVAHADDDARGHIVALGPDQFLATDGSRGLTHWHWPQNSPIFRTLPNNRVPTVELPARIVAAPLVVPSAHAGGDWQVYVADSAGALTLLRGPDLRPEQTWPLGGKITAGPFPRGPYIGCVVERRRLVWIDPSKTGPLWAYTMPGESVVGQPQLVGDLVVVADSSGRFVGLDPASGKVQGAGYTLKANAAPAATPVAFGSDAAFVPLTDGTVLLLGLRHLRDPLAALPALGP